MATITVADYDIVTDKPVDAGTTLNFNTPNINPNIRPVLSWVVIPESSVVHYDMLVNGMSLGPFQASAIHARQEVVNLEISPPKTLDIAISSGQGKFSDIVLLFQVEINFP